MSIDKSIYRMHTIYIKIVLQVHLILGEEPMYLLCGCVNKNSDDITWDNVIS